MILQSPFLWALGVGFLSVLIMIYRKTTYWRKKGIPYMKTLPIFGAIGPVLLRKKCASELSEELYNSCPDAKYFGTMAFNTPAIVIKDPEIIKEITIKSFDFFPNHRSFIIEEFDPLFGRNLFSLKDDRWREMRATLSPSFTSSKMKYMFQLVSQCSTDFVQHLKDQKENMLEEIDLKDIYTRYTNDVIATAAFGISVNSMKNRDNDFYVNGRDAATFEGPLKFFKFVFARICPKFLRFMGLGFLSRKADKFFKALIYDAVRTRKENGIHRPDMINLLMEAQENENGIGMTNEDIIAQAFIFFLAGFDTSARLMCFASHLLSHHPDIQKRLRDEIDDILAEDDGNVNYETLGKMKYMDMVISETLRLYSPTPIIDRICIKDYKLPAADKSSNEFIVEPNTTMWFPVFALHRDPNLFPDPERFDPERFSEENKSNIKPYTYMPFGLGPRRCIGERFALMETKLLIARLLHNFLLRPSSKTPKVFRFNKKSFLLEPENGFWMTLEPRNQ